MIIKFSEYFNNSNIINGLIDIDVKMKNIILFLEILTSNILLFILFLIIEYLIRIKKDVPYQRRHLA